jgi:3-methylfumaryl-CoA hydratase
VGVHAGTRQPTPGLVVHGPLVATPLPDLPRRHRPGARIAAFGFRAAGPLCSTARRCGLAARGRTTAAPWARDAAGAPAMEAAATLA